MDRKDKGEARAEGRGTSDSALSSAQRKRPTPGVFISSSQPTIVFLTVCTKDRRQWLSTARVHELLRSVWIDARGWLVGRYVLMPDHLHLFCAPGEPVVALDAWVQYWKSQYSETQQESIAPLAVAPLGYSLATRRELCREMGLRSQQSRACRPCRAGRGLAICRGASRALVVTDEAADRWHVSARKLRGSVALPPQTRKPCAWWSFMGGRGRRRAAERALPPQTREPDAWWSSMGGRGSRRAAERARCAPWI